jgi:O-antigen/teichoic acid export membrane protein
MGDRPVLPRGQLRRHVIRGTVVNAVVLAGIDLLVLVQGLVVTRLLGPEDIGLYGIVTTTTMTVLALKRVGIDEAFVAQDEPDQEREFQHAFSLELALSSVFALVLLALAPLVAAAYGDHRLLALMAATSYLPLAFALQSPSWVFFRRMDYVRQRLLQAVVPVVTFVVTIPLAAGGLGVWSLILGPAVGNVAGVVVALRVSPYGLGLRWDGAVARRYLRFSGPVFVALAAALLVAQGQVFALDRWGGVAWAGFITLATTLTRYVDRADVIVTSTIYPAIVAIRDRRDAQEELFVRSNRATLLWVLPAAAGVVLFAAALGQLGFNWFSFYRAHGRTRPPAVEAVVGAAAFCALAVPGLAAWGITGFVVGRCAGVALQLGVRARYVRELLPGVRVADVLARPAVPVLAGGAAVLAVRGLLWGSSRPAAQAALELALFAAVVVALSVRLERPLLAELAGALRSRRLPPVEPEAG